MKTATEVEAGQGFRSLDVRDYHVEHNLRGAHVVPRDLRVIRVGHDGGVVVENTRTGRRSRIHCSRLTTGRLFSRVQ